jgi:acetyltransferase-like isoleucine patch superfamily enzyme
MGGAMSSRALPLSTAVRSLRRYSLRSVAGGLLLRRHFDRARLVLWAGGSPRPRIQNRGWLETDVCTLWSGVRIEVEAQGRLSIGQGTYLNRNTVVVCHDRITIGGFCMISWDVVISDTDQHRRPGIQTATAPITIGDGVWIGTRAIILKGVNIGSGAVIGAGAIVTRDVPMNSLAVGQPARVIRSLPPWKAGSLP